MNKEYLKKIVCFGDSNTYGYNAKTIDRFTEEERWTCLLARHLGGGYHVVEEGLEGRTACLDDPLFEGLCGFHYLYPCLMTHKPVDLLLIMLGTNDLKVTFTPSEDVAVRAMEELLKVMLNPYIWEHRKVPKVLIVSPVEIRESITDSHFWGMYDYKSVELSKKLADLYEPLSHRYGCEFLNAAAVAEASLLDGIHMDAENHAKLAEALCKKIKQIL